MQRHRISSRLSVATVALPVLVAAAVHASPAVADTEFTNPYSTDTADNIVAFGDSFTANSDSYVNDNPDQYPTYPRTAGCLTAPDAWPALAGSLTGRPVQNWACNTHTTGQMLDRIDQAVAAGAVNNTTLVILAAGMNDQRQAVPDATIIDNLVTAVTKIRAVAPDAQIGILGRLATTDVEGRFCDQNTVPDQPTGALDPVTAFQETANQANQKAAADRAGTAFIDVRSMTVTEHSTCAPDAQRYVSGITDTTTPDYNMPAHPSLAGSTYLAQQVAALSAATTPETTL
ncbi:SGNH/GDSL hydrolase family protein [Corynebacterium terpenotabidum]|uniref:Secreted esterase A n=1 Tax=Corynebacterium terpenotabidum Y-11 TaxID=1200352 RepID=S4XHB6_9CORY|nr:GDSL-type esterase/lipase family protein [Corynebacterium terpenotabidum]AGP30038.1 secreted esterase A [Corynebacterium terpenotabidum Y-11]